MSDDDINELGGTDENIVSLVEKKEERGEQMYTDRQIFIQDTSAMILASAFTSVNPSEHPFDHRAFVDCVDHAESLWEELESRGHA